MFSRKFFANMRRGGFGLGLSKSKLAQAMVEILVQIPEDTPHLKDVVVANLGLLGNMTATRDINAAWDQAKKRAAREHPDKFILDNRHALQWNTGTANVLDRKITAANFKRLNVLADEEHCSVDSIVSKLIASYRKANARRP